MQDVSGSLVFTQGGFTYWSFDTLRTRTTPGATGSWGLVIDKCEGWVNGENYLCRSSSDTVNIFYTSDFGSNFTLLNSTTELDTLGQIFRGKAPGELYYLNHHRRTLSSSLDYGATWTEGALFDQHTNYMVSWQIGFKYGVNPGELYCIWQGYFAFPLL